MVAQPITINLPLPLYDRLKHRAEQLNTSVEDEVLQVVAAAVPETTELGAETDHALVQMVNLSDEELWRAAKSHLANESAGKLESLHFKRQRQGLSAAEEGEVENLVRQYELAMLIRAQAAALLNQRGFDVSKLYPSG